MPGYVDMHAHMWPQWGVHSPQPCDVLGQPRVRRDDDARSADVDDRRHLRTATSWRPADHRPAHLHHRPRHLLARQRHERSTTRSEVMKRYSRVLPHRDDQAVHGRRPPGSGSGSSWRRRSSSITPTLEGGLDFKKNMTEAMDGYAGIEHTLPIAPLYKDVVQLFAQSGTT